MFRHQVKTGRKDEKAFNTLAWTFKTSTDPDVVFKAWKSFYFSTGGYAPPEKPNETPFREFIRGQRANRR
jgi:hypothetical protein